MINQIRNKSIEKLKAVAARLRPLKNGEQRYKQYLQEKALHDQSCVDGYITHISKFPPFESTETRCMFCYRIEKAKRAKERAVMEKADARQEHTGVDQLFEAD